MPPAICKICKDNFNPETKFPMILPCGRSLCHTCVLRYLQDPRQRCFMCSGNHPDVTMAHLRRNYDLMDASVPPDSVLSDRVPPGSVLSDSVPPGSGVSLSSSAEQSSETLQLVLMDLQNNKQNLHVHATVTVLTAKNLINDMYGIDPGTNLIFCSKILQNNRTLASYGVKTGNTLQVTTKFKGGRLPHTGV